jgi:hypothetical protein
VETSTDLGAQRDEVSAVQHHDTDLLLRWQILRASFPAALSRPDESNLRMEG